LIPAGNLELFFQIQKVKHFVLEHGFDIIHAHLPWAGILARFVGKKLPIPIVYTEHNTWERYNKISYLGNRMTFKHQDVAIAVSNEVALSMRLNSIWDPYRRGQRLKIRVVQNGVNTEVFKKETEDRRPKTEDGRPKMEDRRQETEDRRRETEDRRRETEDRRRKTEDGRPKTGDGRQKTEDRRRKTGDRRPKTGDRRQKTEDGRRKMGETGHKTQDIRLEYQVSGIKYQVSRWREREF
jgi:glycosyltransferase involved in cell wall biosynthesis